MDRGPGQPIPGARPLAADQARSGPQLAHSHRERSTEPLPLTIEPASGTVTGSDLGFRVAGVGFEPT